MINFYPSKLQTTLADTVGSTYKWTRKLAVIAIIASGFIFAFLSHVAGFLLLCVASVIHEALLAREYYIDSIQKIRTATDLRLRLLTLNDSEFALESLANDSTWRGDPIDPEITNRLATIRKEKEEAQVNLKNFLDKLTEQFNKSIEPVPPKDEGKPN